MNRVVVVVGKAHVAIDRSEIKKKSYVKSIADVLKVKSRVLVVGLRGLMSLGTRIGRCLAPPLVDLLMAPQV